MEDTTTTGKDQATKVDLTQEQLDEVIKKAMGRAGKEYRDQAEAAAKKLEEMEAELTELRRIKEEKAASGSKVDETDTEALKAQLDEMRKANQSVNQMLERLKREKEATDQALLGTKAEALNIKKRVAMQEAAAKYGFFDLDDILNLTDRFVKFDGNEVLVVSDNGATRMNGVYDNMTLEEFYKEYAEKKPHLVKANHRAGTGATSSNSSAVDTGAFTLEKVFGPKSDARVAVKLKQTNPDEYRRLRDQARAAGLL